MSTMRTCGLQRDTHAQSTHARTHAQHGTARHTHTARTHTPVTAAAVDDDDLERRRVQGTQAAHGVADALGFVERLQAGTRVRHARA